MYAGERPFYIDAGVVSRVPCLREHGSSTGDDACSDRIKAIRTRFVQAPPTEGRSWGTNCER